jgi:hypothetical protein
MATAQKKPKSAKPKKKTKTTPKTAIPYQSPTVSDDDSDPLDPLDPLLLHDLINSKPDDIPKPIRLDNAYAEWLAEEAAEELEPSYKKKSGRRIAQQHSIGESALRYRIACKRSKAQEAESRQRLTPLEEEALKNWCLQLEVWNFPARIESLRRMVETMCRAKGDFKPIGHNFQDRFFKRWPELKSKFAPPLDKQRAGAEDPAVFQRYFELFHALVTQYNINPLDIYNMDEKGFMQGIFEKSKVVVSRDERFKGKSYCIQDGSREWTTVIDCVSVGGRYLSPWVIFKGVYCKKDWVDRMIIYDPLGKITMSHNGWTDNCIGYNWFEKCFIPQTGGENLHGEYRMMIFDGHASHLSSDVIRLCLTHKVILLCLPPHTTHLLQPLDIGLFSPLTSYYKTILCSICKFGYNYAVDKVDFLEGYLKARNQAFTVKNITSAWRKAGLYPFAPKVIIKKIALLEMPLVVRLITPLLSIIPTPLEALITPTTTLSTSQPLLLTETPTNISDVQRLLLNF